jgi:hypothetical protein
MRFIVTERLRTGGRDAFACGEQKETAKGNALAGLRLEVE